MNEKNRLLGVPPETLQLGGGGPQGPAFWEKCEEEPWNLRNEINPLDIGLTGSLKCMRKIRQVERYET